MADMIKFYKGLVGNLPETGANGALYITTDEGAIYLGTGTGMKRLGDFVQVDKVASLPEKAHESCLYYCVAENILAKWNGTEWKQINKQPTAEELKTLLGLGSLAYKSEVAEADLGEALAAKINAASGAQHTHDNKAVLDGITAEKVAAWDSAEADAIAHADGLNTAMNTRVEALEAIDHEHANKALLDTYTQTEANLADAVAKKHAHANADELAKIADGDKEKWDAVVADHLTSADKTTLENAIKEAKKAGTDANTALETYKVANDARVLAVEEDVAEITNAESGILAQAKAYADGKDTAIAEAKKAGTDAAAALEAYKTANDEALAGVTATADAAAVKTEVEAELAKKVDKESYEADKATFATKTELGNVDAKFANYNTTAAQKAIDDAQDAEIAKKVDKVEGKDLIATSEIERLATLHNYDDTALAGRVTTAEGKITALETASAAYALKTDVEAVDAKITTLNGDANTDGSVAKAVAEGVETAQSYADGVALTAEDNAKSYALDLYGSLFESDESGGQTIRAIATEEAEKVEEKLTIRVKAIEDDYLVESDKTELANAISAEKERAEGIEGGLRTDVDAIKADYLKASDKEALQTQINTIMNNPDAEGAINSINEFTKYVEDHGTIAEGFRTDIDKNKEDIAANAKAIADQATADAATYETKTDAAAKLAEAKEYADGINTALDARLDTLEAINHDAYTAADATLKAELQAEIDADVKALADGAVATNAAAIAKNAEDIATKANASDVYTKTETYTKAEVEALLTWGSF